MARLESLIVLLDRSKKRLALAGFVALLIHLPLTPAMPVLRLAHRLSAGNDAPKPLPPQEVEVELQEALRHEEKRQRAPDPKPQRANVQMESAPSVRFAQGATPREEEKGDRAPKDPRKDRMKQVGLEGDPDRKIIGRPAVTIALWFQSLRDSPLSKELTAIAACDREWRRFLDQGVDPLSDLDGVLVVGPSLFDSAELTVAVQHHLPAERVSIILQALIQASGDQGRWLAPNVASVRLARRPRVLMPLREDLFFVTPSKGWEALHRVKAPLRVPSAEGRAASLTLVDPNRVLGRLGVTLPKGIRELRLELFSNADQSVDVRVELGAASSAAAARDAERAAAQLKDLVTDLWSAATTLGSLTGTNGGSSHLELPPRLDLELDDQTLSGMLRLSPGQTRATLSLLSSFVCRKGRGGAARASK